MGENVTDATTYEADLESLINYVKEKSPKATIVVIGDWWSVDKNEMRKTAAANTNVIFVNLEDLIGDKAYQSSTGIICNKSDGTTITVSEAASTHPGDEGMKEIANRIIEALKNQE
ncbi:SGNH/GDSL hydrolase family protein [Butyrivibrio sp. FC2001]|uniref:SGNH/GDSL hydrolase family protein n=1 Tax=Butyrivibrio sp. FC2001 TaxID=1280671 RepID=UPI000400C700|nr:SGNH/GDSL hydrolase family protein [Butyrivibrio sp. FC2001]